MPDVQETFLKLVALEAQRTDLVARANASWVAGRRAEAQKLARHVVRIERQIKRLKAQGLKRTRAPALPSWVAGGVDFAHEAPDQPVNGFAQPLRRGSATLSRLRPASPPGSARRARRESGAPGQVSPSAATANPGELTPGGYPHLPACVLNGDTEHRVESPPRNSWRPRSSCPPSH